GVVASTASRRDIVEGGTQAADDALYPVPRFADEVYGIAIDQTEPFEVGDVHHDHIARAVDAAQTIIVTVDGRVELVVAASRDQGEDVIGLFRKVGILGQAGGCNERCFAALRLPRALPCRVRPIEAFG